MKAIWHIRIIKTKFCCCEHNRFIEWQNRAESISNDITPKSLVISVEDFGVCFRVNEIQA